ncbi:MAG: hypothetical protein N4A40_10590 [Tissierellales bacterium]|jgi:hypothetical protein|nr:hypothetical protein [Tissierellales bacterium]
MPHQKALINARARVEKYQKCEKEKKDLMDIRKLAESIKDAKKLVEYIEFNDEKINDTIVKKAKTLYADLESIYLSKSITEQKYHDFNRGIEKIANLAEYAGKKEDERNDEDCVGTGCCND